MLDAAAGGEQLLTGDDIYNWSLRWSEGGTQLAFSSNRGGQHNVHVMNIDGSGASQIAFTCNGSFDRRWSPDGDDAGDGGQDGECGGALYFQLTH